MAVNNVLYILNILRDYSSKSRPITKSEIMEKLSSDYGIFIDRKQLYRKMEQLEEADFPVIKTSGRYATYYYDHVISNPLEIILMMLVFSDFEYLDDNNKDRYFEMFNDFLPQRGSIKEKYYQIQANIQYKNNRRDISEIFNIVTHAMIENLSIRYKSKVDQKFTDYQYDTPIQISIDNHRIFIITKKMKKIFLDEMYNVEAVKR